MKKTILYRYLGTNGTITSPVHLEDVYYIRMVKLIASPGKRLTDGETVLGEVIVAEEDANLWQEINWVPSSNE